MERFFAFVGMVLVTLAIFAGVLLTRTALFASRQVDPSPYTPIALDPQRAAAHLAEAVRFKTISHQDPAQFDAAPFEAFRAFLAERYPKAHAAMQRETVGEHSLLYTWPGSDAAAPPIILLAHYDVVPVEPGTEGDWTHPAFDGVIADGFVWGRGAIDFKSGIIGILEAAEALLAEGYQPRRTVHFAFGHDEEIGGGNGAARMAALLQERGVKAHFLLDEGAAVTQGIVPGIDGPLALIGLAEKGYVSLELIVEGTGGHSSNPPPQTNIGILAAAIARLEKNQLPARLEGPVREMFDHAGPEMKFPMRLVMANLWLFKGLVKKQLTATAAANAALRTTTAATIFEAGTKENVLPARARAVVNFRILPGETVETVLEHAHQAVNDSRVHIAPVDSRDINNPTPVASAATPVYQALANSIRQVYPDAVVAPTLTLGGTDAKHYYGVTENIYRIQPMLFTTKDLEMIHGTNERLAIDNLANGIRVYAQVIRNMAS